MMIELKFLTIIFLGYFLGAIPFGVLIGKMRGIDVRKFGSGRIGGTNVMRTLGNKAGILVIALDVAKAALAVILARVIVGDSILVINGFPLHWQIAQVMAALAALIGHNWSVFIGFHGGRGVAPFFGGLAAMCFPAALFGAQILLLGAAVTRYMSVGSIFGSLAAWSFLVPLTLGSNFPPFYLVYGLLGAALVVYRHRDNIARLQAGIERKLGEKAERINF